MLMHMDAPIFEQFSKTGKAVLINPLNCFSKGDITCLKQKT
jgi:hypothetical protein